jgi:hypothetical protein
LKATQAHTHETEELSGTKIDTRQIASAVVAYSSQEDPDIATVRLRVSEQNSLVFSFTPTRNFESAYLGFKQVGDEARLLAEKSASGGHKESARQA